MSDKEVTTRIYETDRDQLNALSSKHGMKSAVILGYIIDKAVEYRILEEGWEKELAEKEFQQLLADTDIEFRKKVELRKVKAQIDAKMFVFKEWMKTLDNKDRKQFLDNVLGDMRGENFLDRLTNYQMFLIDGEKRLLPMDENGYPVISYVMIDEIIKCYRGFHIKNNRCNCRDWATCEHGKTSYENWLAVNGTALEQRRYLEEHSRTRRFERSR